MRQITLAAAALAAVGFATVTVAYAEAYYGPRQNGDQCYIRQVGELGYWGQCRSGQTAQATRANTNRNNSSKSASKKK